MPPPLHLSPLNVPEILLNIGYYMPNPSLATCLQVNRYFHQTLEPLLFSELVLTQNKFRRPSPAALQSAPRQLFRHVRHLSLSYYISVDYLSLEFRHLTSISLQGFIGGRCCEDHFDFSDDEEEPSQVGGDKEIMDALQTLIYKNPGLRRWNLHRPILQLTSNVWRAIAAPTEAQAFQEENTTRTMTTTKPDSPQLDVLNVSDTTINLESIPLFLAACRATKKLKVAACTLQGLRNHHTNQLRAPPVYGHGNDGPYVPQSVHFNDIIGLSVLSQLEFLARCPDVQEIQWESTIRPKNGMKIYRWLNGGGDKSMNQPLPTMEDFRRLIQSGTWMHLRSLVVRGIFDQYKHRIHEFIPDGGFAHILESIPAQQLVKLECRGTAFGPLGLVALKRHCESLETLVVKWSSSFTSALVQEALESFPNVTCLRVDRLAFEDIERGGPWVCLGLKALLVPFDMGVAIDIEDEQRRHRLVFDRISTLVRLVRLAINYDGTDEAPRLQFTTSYGLGALSTLINFSFLDVSESYQSLEMADVLWMVEKWPKLRTVEGDLHPDNHKDHVLQKYLRDHIGTTETQQ